MLDMFGSLQNSQISRLFAAMYAGTLTAALAVPAYEAPIDSLWDMLDAARARGYKLVAEYETTNEFLFLVDNLG